MKRFLIVAFLAWGLAQFAQKQTDGFAIGKLATFSPENGVIDASLLDRSYRYWTKGGQSYVFLSEDGQHVLKMFRSSRLQMLKSIPKVLPIFNRAIEKNQLSLNEAIQSYILAENFLGKETGLSYAHLTPNKKIAGRLRIVDRLGISHDLDPSLYPFVIQKRGFLVKERIDQLMGYGDIEGAKSALKNLFVLLQNRIEKGIEDADPNLCKNFGFCGNTAIQLDAGRFSLEKNPSLEKIASSKEDLEHWIHAHYPMLSEDFQQYYEDFIHAAL